MAQMHFDFTTQRWVKADGTSTKERERKVLMDGHDALLPEWRALSRMIEGRAIERHFKRGTPMARVRKAVLTTHRGSTL